MTKHLLKLTLIVVLLVVSVTISAQVTTSGLSGTVRAGNEPAIGATIVAVHQPSGTRYGTVTNAEGRYNLSGLRSGGPYRIEFSYVGFSRELYEEVQLRLGETFVLNANLRETAVQIGEVSVVARRAPEFNSERNGAAVNISSQDIAMMPTISRSITDLTRLTPQANGNQIGGGNFRQNFITVDGAAFNNAFGIGTNLPGSGAPISIDALDQISVNITPFDVRQSGFIGAAINAVTKSGTNEFKGSVYTFMQNETFKGNKVGEVEFERTPASFNLWGMTVGGPIVKDKLFFFLNLETEMEEVPGPSRVAATPENPADFTKNIARPTAAEMDMISKYLYDTFGYETGPYQGYSFESPAARILARIDWNINNNHRFNIRYSYNSSKSPTPPSTSVSPFSGIYTGNRQAMDAMWFKNSGYFQERNFSSLSSELNSNFFDGKVANTLRVTYSYQDEPRSTEGDIFPFVDILKDNRVFTSFGTELFSYGNLREVKTTTITDDVTFSIGNHNITAGLQYEHNHTVNGFMRFGTGFYVFNSWEDFVGGAKPRNYGITFSNTPGYEQAFPSFVFQQFSAYIQNRFTVSPKLNVTAGIRADLPVYNQPLDEHPIIATLDFGGRTYSTAQLPKQRVLVSPRFGFNYDIFGDRSLMLRGGSGIFTGRVPFVWIVGQVSDAGMIQTTQTFSGVANTPGPFSPDPRAYLPAVQPPIGTIVPQTFTVIDPDFKLPQSWKSSLAIDAELPFGIKGSLEGIYNKDINTAFFVNRGLKDGTAMNIPNYPDNRIMYLSGNTTDKFYYLRNSAGAIVATGGNGVSPIVLENREGGYYYSITAKLEKEFDNGLSAMIAYTRSDARNLVDGSGDQAASAWNGNANVNGANSPELSFPSYVLPDKVIGNLSYRFEYAKNFATSFSLFYEGSIQGRYSYVYTTNIVRDGAGSNNLIYVPNNPSEITFVNQTVNVNGTNVVWTAQEQSDAFFAFIEQDPYLRTRKGKYAERNGAMLPWVNKFDIKIAQEFYLNVGGKRNTLQVSLDILNVGNLLNSDWGKNYRFNQNNILVMQNNSAVTATGTTVPTFRLNPLNNAMLTNTFSDVIGYSSTYAFQLGVRYIFN